MVWGYYNEQRAFFEKRNLNKERLEMIPIILCGGAGARLWPISEKKPFYKFFDHSLFEMTVERLKDYKPILIVSVKELKSSIEEALEKKNYKAEIIYEPETRNTAISIALACHLLNQRQRDKDIVGIFPSDHFIGKELEFQKLISAGIQIAQKEQKIVTFGIPPYFPCSDYGYIKVTDTCEELDAIAVKKAVGFVEKPLLSESTSLAKEGYLWNSGIFLCPVNILIEYFEKYLPDLWNQILRVKEDRACVHEVYRNLESISFDKGIMEKINQYICLSSDIGWWDLGSWDRVAQWDKQFPQRLKNKAQVVSKDSKENFVFSVTDQHIGLVGMKGIIVINSDGGLLIANKGTGEKVKFVNKEFAKQDIKKKQKWVKKPWGAYQVIKEEGLFKYKEIEVKPGHQLSYQSHRNRSEHWLVISGLAEVTVEGSKSELKVNEHIFIAQGAKHRLRNPTDKMLNLLEIQMGSYLGEDDIVRYEDDYGRS